MHENEGRKREGREGEREVERWRDNRESWEVSRGRGGGKIVK